MIFTNLEPMHSSVHAVIFVEQAAKVCVTFLEIVDGFSKLGEVFLEFMGVWLIARSFRSFLCKQHAQVQAIPL